ncbi:MAG: response regulator [Pseudobdellovibrionaceae bacterium]
MFDAKTKVLVIDDMKTMRKLVIRALAEIGLTQVCEAEDGSKAWETLTTELAKFDLIISDWNMPNCTGLELLKKVRSDSRFSKLPFVLLTAESEKTQVIEALKVGVSAYVVKPFNTETLRTQLTDIYKKNAA